MKFPENPTSSGRVVPFWDIQTEGRTDTTKFLGRAQGNQQSSTTATVEQSPSASAVASVAILRRICRVTDSTLVTLLTKYFTLCVPRQESFRKLLNRTMKAAKKI